MKKFTRVCLWMMILLISFTVLRSQAQKTTSYNPNAPIHISELIAIEIKRNFANSGQMTTFEQQALQDYESLTAKAIVVDPIDDMVTVYPMMADYWTGTTDGVTKTDPSEVRGYNIEDGWFMFDISVIPPGATVNNIEFFGYVNATYYPYWSMTPVTSDPLTTDAATLYADINAEATVGYYLYQNELSTYETGWKQNTLGGTANDDLEAAIDQGWFALGMVSRDNSSTYYIIWDGWNETNIPYLVVDYETEPLPPPENLIAEYLAPWDVLLTWNSPPGKDLLGYNVYYSFDSDNPIAYTTDIAYLDEDLSPGTYEYFVTAVYDAGESDPSNFGNTIVPPPTVLNAEPLAFDATLVEDQTASSHLFIANTGNWLLHYHVDIVYEASDTCYPISSAYWTGTTDSLTKTDSSVVRGFDNKDGWFMFDISAVPPGAIITNIEFNGYVNNTNYPYWSMTPVTSNPLITDPATLYVDINAEVTDGYYLYQNETSAYTPGWKQHVLGGTANNDLQVNIAQGLGWFAMGMACRDNSPSYYIEWDGWNEANIPYIIVSYATGSGNWLTLDSGQTSVGTVNVGDPADDIMVGFDATGLPAGVYNCNIIVTANDPNNSPVTIPVSMIVFTAPGYSITGNLNYANSAATPMDNVVVNLFDGDIHMGTATTDAAGAYAFYSLPDGTFDLRYLHNKDWGDCNIFDINLSVAYMSNTPLPPFQVTAGNVDLMGDLDIFDINNMVAMLTFAIPPPLNPGSWPAEAYLYDVTQVIVSGGNVVEFIQSVCSGDVDLSFTPPVGK